METYFAIVNHEPGAAFGLTFPDLPGCFAAADHERGLYDAARDALTLFAEGCDDLPAARTIEQLLADDAVRDDIRHGAVLIGVPLLTFEHKLRVNVVLDAALLQGLDETADAVGLNRSEFIASAVRDRLQATLGAAYLQRRRRSKSAAASALTQKKK